jgi:hypothetical protein
MDQKEEAPRGRPEGSETVASATRRIAHPTSRRSWIEAALALGVAQVAELLGLEPGRPIGDRPTFACPSCWAPTRHTKTKDKRGAVGLTSDLGGWRCFQCDLSGDAVDLVAAKLAGRRLANCNAEEKVMVRQWFADRGATAATAKRLVLRPRSEATPPRYPPGVEVEALWEAAGAVDDDDEVAAFLELRGLDPDHVAELDLARALPVGVVLPRWAWGPRGGWTATGHRLIVPLYDAIGALRSLIARAVSGSEPKSLAPAKHSRRDLLMADGLGHQLLETGAAPAWWDRDVPLMVAIAEGEIDFLGDATEPEPMADSGHGPAVLGIVEGSWLTKHAERVPDGARVLISTDTDSAGDAYAKKIVLTFIDRDVELERRRPCLT